MININANVGPHLTMEQFRESHVPGVYLVYRLNREDQRLRLIYIGHSTDVGTCASSDGDLQRKWMSWAYGDQSALRFSLITLDDASRRQVCAEALVRFFVPGANQVEGLSSMIDDVQVMFSGRRVCNCSVVTVQRNL